MKKPIVIIMAMHDEAKHLIQLLGFSRRSDQEINHEPAFPIEIHTTHLEQQELILLLPEYHPVHNVDSIGTQMAAITTWEAIRRFSPGLILNMGTAGGFSAQGAQVGDIYLVQQPVYYHDRYIPIGNFESYGYGGFTPHPIKVLTGEISFKDGVLSSSNSFVSSASGEALLKKLQVSLVDMEAAAVAEVATRLQVPFVVLKIISDLADQPHNAQEFEQNISHIGEELAVAAKVALAAINFDGAP